MTRKDRKQREYERREEEILDATLALCSKPDWKSVTVEQIAEEAGVGKGTVYNHFGSKDELLFRLMIRFYRSLLAALRAGLADRPPKVQLRSIIQQALHFHVAHPEYRYIVQHCEQAEFKERAEPGWRDDFLELDRAFQDWGDPLIEAGMEAGEFARRPVGSVMLGVHAAFKGAIAMIWVGDDWCRHDTAVDKIIPAVTDFIMAALVGEA